MEEGFGSREQWSGVGDTWVLGCLPDPANIFFDKNKKNDEEPQFFVALGS